jgi:hypothetical protein
MSKLWTMLYIFFRYNAQALLLLENKNTDAHSPTRHGHVLTYTSPLRRPGMGSR